MLYVTSRTCFALNSKELAASIFNTGGTANGTYKVLRRKCGTPKVVQFFKPTGDIFAAWVNNKHGERFFVSATRVEGKVYYMHGLGDNARIALGLDGLTYAEEKAMAKSLWDRLPCNA